MLFSLGSGVRTHLFHRIFPPWTLLVSSGLPSVTGTWNTVPAVADPVWPPRGQHFDRAVI